MQCPVRNVNVKILSASLLTLAIVASLLIRPDVSFAVPGGTVYPLMGTRISSDYGIRKHPVLKKVKHHGGIDLAAPKDAPIRSIRDGTVVFADPYGSYGNLVVISHAGGFTSHYGHCSSIKVRTGQRISAGHVIATVGSTGRVTGPHLHFEIRKNGTPEDPERFIPGLADAAQG